MNTIDLAEQTVQATVYAAMVGRISATILAKKYPSAEDIEVRVTVCGVTVSVTPKTDEASP